MLKRGSVVISLKGKDKDLLLCVASLSEKGVLVCDGKKRRLDNPKLKNPKHLKALDKVLSEEQMRTDKQLRKALNFNPEA
jgi:ribosomal protein L14E/L6E/L27E